VTRLRVAGLSKFTDDMAKQIADATAPLHAAAASSSTSKTTFDGVAVATELMTRLSSVVEPLQLLIDVAAAPRTLQTSLAAIGGTVASTGAAALELSDVQGDRNAWLRVAVCLRSMPVRRAVPPTPSLVALLDSIGQTLSAQLFGPRALFNGMYANARSALARVCCFFFFLL
jgi:hypothetical protein